MAGSTFLVLTNKLLRRLNEVQLTETSFADARNVQAMAKDAIVAAIAEINTKESQWPWNKQTGTAVASTATSEFNWSADPAVPFWYSFRIVGVPGSAIESSPLGNISQEEYFKYFRQLDLDSIPNGGLQTPKYVYPIVGGFGVTPRPDQNYTISYEYYTIPADLDAFNDQCAIPTAFDYVIVNFALKHYYMYKDNTQQAQVWSAEANNTFHQMRAYAVDRPDSAWSNMINYGGNKWNSDYTKL